MRNDNQRKRWEPGMKQLLTQLGVYTSSPVAFLVLILYADFGMCLSRKLRVARWSHLGNVGHDARYSARRASRHSSHPREAG